MAFKAEIFAMLYNQLPPRAELVKANFGVHTKIKIFDCPTFGLEFFCLVYLIQTGKSWSILYL